MSLNISVDAMVAEIDGDKLVTRESVAVKVGTIKSPERDQGKEKIAEEKILEDKLEGIAKMQTNQKLTESEQKKEEETKSIEDSADDMII